MAHRRPVLGDLTNRQQQQRMPLAKSTRGTSGTAAQGPRTVPYAPSATLTAVPKGEKPHRSDLEVPDYLETIWRNDRKAETKYIPPADYMERVQVEVTGDMRGICLDWIIECASRFKMDPATTFLTANILDRFLAKKAIRRERMQMVSMVALIVAAKYEEIYPPRIKDYIHISANSFTREDMLRYEHYILHALGYSLTTPTPYHFLSAYVHALKGTGRAENKEESNTRHAACFIAECAMLKLSIYINTRPSLLAAASVYAGRQLLGLAPWPPQVAAVCEHSESAVADCAAQLMTQARAVKDGKLKATMKRYGDDNRGSVSHRLV